MNRASKKCWLNKILVLKIVEKRIVTMISRDLFRLLREREREREREIERERERGTERVRKVEIGS